MQSVKTKTYDETLALGEKLGASIADGTVIALYGDLGAGKTAFVKGIAKGMGIDSYVTSPTFAIVNEYQSGKRKLCHFDMYRINSWDDLYSTAYFDYLDTSACLAIEWSENIENALPENTLRVRITALSGNERNFDFYEMGERFENSCL